MSLIRINWAWNIALIFLGMIKAESALRLQYSIPKVNLSSSVVSCDSNKTLKMTFKRFAGQNVPNVLEQKCC